MTASCVRADNSGLGTLAREFYDNGIVQKVLIVRNPRYRIFPERFPGARITDQIQEEDIEWLLKDTDSLLFFETPYDWEIIPEAKKRGIKTIIMPMHEGLPTPPPQEPDLWLCPSSLEVDLGLPNSVYLPVPVNTDRIKWRKRQKAKVFVHNAGHGGIIGRNGTHELIEALKLTKAKFKLILRSQAFDYKITDPRVEVRFENLENYWDVWKEGDVFIFPEKFNGLSLPIQESFASGMLVMTTDRKPNNEYLPNEPLIHTDGLHSLKITRRVEVSIIKPESIAQKIEQFCGRDISEYSEMGRKWGEENSWKNLKTKYLEILK